MGTLLCKPEYVGNRKDYYTSTDFKNYNTIAINTITTLDADCPICLENYKPLQLAVHTKCHHLFHEDCFMAWNKKSNTCPICRTVLEPARS